MHRYTIRDERDESKFIDIRYDCTNAKHAIPPQTYVKNKEHRQAPKHQLKHDTGRYGVFFGVLRKSINHSKCPFTLIGSDVFFKHGHSAADVLHRWICAEKKYNSYQESSLQKAHFSEPGKMEHCMGGVISVRIIYAMMPSMMLLCCMRL